MSTPCSIIGVLTRMRRIVYEFSAKLMVSDLAIVAATLAGLFILTLYTSSSWDTSGERETVTVPTPICILPGSLVNSFSMHSSSPLTFVVAFTDIPLSSGLMVSSMGAVKCLRLTESNETSMGAVR